MHQGLRRLREGVGDAVAEALSQARPVLDGLGLTTAVAHDLGDVFGLAPGTLVREQGQLVDGRWSGQQHGREDGSHQDPEHCARGL